MNHIEIECTNVFSSEHSAKSLEEKSIIFTQKWVEFINQKENQER